MSLPKLFHRPGTLPAACGQSRVLALILVMINWAGTGLIAAKAEEPPAPTPLFQTAQSIESAIQNYLKQKVAAGTSSQFQVSPLDPRLQLKTCDQPLEVQTNTLSAPQGGRLTVQVSCQGEAPWRIYVPVKIMTPVTVLSLARPLAAGTQITAQDLTTQVVNANSQTSAYLTQPSDAVGQVVTRPMQAGQILTPQDINAAQIIKRGDRVTLIAGGDGVSVSAEGIAQGSAGAGQRLMVKNSRSGAQIEGIVRDAHTVVIP